MSKVDENILRYRDRYDGGEWRAMCFVHGTIQHSTAVQESAAGISGTWSATFTIAGQSVPVVLRLTEKDGLVTGTVESDHTGPGKISDGTWKENSLNCTLKFEKHESIALSGMLKGEIFAGEFKTEGMQGTWGAKRGGTKAIGHMMATSQHMELPGGFKSVQNRHRHVQNNQVWF